MKQHKGLALFFVCVSFLLSHTSMAQSTIGKEFILGFMENNRKATSPDKAVIIVIANEPASGSILFQGQSFPFSLIKGQSFVKEFLSTSQDVIHRDSEKVDSKSFTVSSSGNISVYGYNSRQTSSDASLVLPLNLLGDEYFVTAHFSPLNLSPDNSESTILIIATEDDTQVQITPTQSTLNGNSAGAPILITLNQGQSYQIKANGDLTGTHVKVLNANQGNCKKIAVFGGNKMTSAGDCGKTGDHLFQQTIPVEFWGKSYIHVPLRRRTSGELVKVLASEDATQVTVDGQLKGTLNSGEFLTLEFTPSEVAAIETSKPTAVTLLAKSQDCNSIPDNIGDPFLLTYQSNQQTIKDIEFYSIKSFYNDANIISPTASLAQIRLNGVAITAQFSPVPGKPELSYAQVTILDGKNTFTSPDGAIIYVYGAGQRSSYGYSAGFNLAGSTATADEVAYEFSTEGEPVACVGKEGTWEILPKDELFTFFKWDFRDGTPLKDGKMVSHTFAKAGKYKVLVLASSGQGSCDISTEYEFEIEVFEEAIATIQGPVEVCPEREVTYTIEGQNLDVNAEWGTVTGGLVISETEKSITIKWNSDVTEGSIQAQPYLHPACLGGMIELKVGITKVELLEAPEGVSSSCGSVTEPLSYKVPQASASAIYTWLVKGGQLVSGGGTSEVKVTWDATSLTKEISYTVEDPSSASCSTQSKVLILENLPAIKIDEVKKLLPACPGDSNGTIDLIVSGGTGSFDFLWSHDAKVNSATASGLKAGTYLVTVSDKSGCGILKQQITLEDPASLALADALELIPTTCAGISDGGFRAKVKGGTPPYTIEGIASIWNGEYLEVKNMASGNFSLFILDSKGCSMAISATVPENKPLSISFTEVAPGCPGGASGQLSLSIAGGKPPYQISWTQGSQDDLLAISSTKVLPFSGQTISEMPSGFYTASVADANGCAVMGTGRITEVPPLVRMPTGFQPKEGKFEPVSNCSISYTLQIWDSWGQVIYFGNEGWDGSINGKDASIGAYTYQLTYSYSIEGVVEQISSRGVFTVIR